MKIHLVLKGWLPKITVWLKYFCATPSERSVQRVSVLCSCRKPVLSLYSVRRFASVKTSGQEHKSRSSGKIKVDGEWIGVSDRSYRALSNTAARYNWEQAEGVGSQNKTKGQVR
jgi:hypothetical protein